MLSTKKITLIIISIFLLGNAKSQVYYVSSSLGNDQNDGLSIQSPFQSIEKLNSMVFSPGDSINFKSGDYWEGMFWLKGSGVSNNSIVVDIYGGVGKATINGNGYQSCILIYNDEYISINKDISTIFYDNQIIFIFFNIFCDFIYWWSIFR